MEGSTVLGIETSVHHDLGRPGTINSMDYIEFTTGNPLSISVRHAWLPHNKMYFMCLLDTSAFSSNI